MPWVVDDMEPSQEPVGNNWERQKEKQGNCGQDVKRSSSKVAAVSKAAGQRRRKRCCLGTRCHPQYFMMMPCDVISLYILTDPFSKRGGTIPASSIQPALFSPLTSAGGR